MSLAHHRRDERLWEDEDNAIDALRRSIATRHGVDAVEMLESHQQGAIARARREWIRLVQDSWGLTISETARLLGVDRCAVRGARR